MKRTKKITMALLAVCFMAAGVFGGTQRVHAAKLNNSSEAEAKALEKVPNAVVAEIDSDYENGVLVYEVDLIKGNTKYDITYRASDAKMMKYKWEKISVSAKNNKALISQSKCRQLAQNKVKNGTILSISKKVDDGIDIYKVKMTAGNKAYTLKYHARTGALIEYEWKLTNASSGSSSSSNPSSSSNTGDDYIGVEKAKQIALNKVPGAVVHKAEFDTEDGVPVYEVELKKGNYEYEFEIHAKTGEILKQEKEWDD